jgi:hypothetical protein
MRGYGTHLELFLGHDDELVSAMLIVGRLGSAVGDLERCRQRLGVTVHHGHMHHRRTVLKLQLLACRGRAEAGL